MKVSSYKELDVWKNGMEIVHAVYDITMKFPSEERFGLSSQMRRSAVSIPSNIAEGFMRRYTREYLQFCHVALGSSAELETQLIIASRRKYLRVPDAARLHEMIDHEGRMLTNLAKALRRHL